MGMFITVMLRRDEIAHLPFVITDAVKRRPQKWQIWGMLSLRIMQPPQERERAEIFVQNAPASSMIETTHQNGTTAFTFIMRAKPYYGLVVPFIVFRYLISIWGCLFSRLPTDKVL